MYRKSLKRIFDFIVALLLFILFLPLMFLIAVIIKTSSIRTIFFIHERPGRFGKPIRLIKFKTMNDKRDDKGKLLPNKERITPLGNFLRKYSLDELPQLVNVIKGDLSLVGPRPLEMRYLKLYTVEQNRRHEVKPGITGWAQVNGRNALSWEEKFKFDVWYVDNLSFLLDLKILILTIKKVLVSEGINSSADHTVIPLDEYLKNINKAT
jgi:sugar transferase EpsL